MLRFEKEFFLLYIYKALRIIEPKWPDVIMPMYLIYAYEWLSI